MDDLAQEGVDFTAYLVNCNYMDDLISFIASENFSLICLDSSFTVDLVNDLLTRFPNTPMLVGGVNALSLFLHTKIPFAVFGPGRTAASEFMSQFFGDEDYTQVGNLFFKIEDKIHYSSKTISWDLPSEILPYAPYLPWDYLGPNRKENANTEAVSIVAATGCPHANAMPTSERYDIRGSVRSLGYDLSDAARTRLDGIFNRKTHGCSFCVFQLQEYTVYPVSETVDLLLHQATHLFENHQTKAFCIQTENPFPFLNPFLQALLENKIPVEFVSIRTRPDFLLKQQKKLHQALDLAKKNGFHFSIEEIGFETFVEEELLLFNKGVSVEANLKALACLREIKNTYEETVSIHVGHGIILFHPWTTVEGMKTTLEVMARHTDVFPRFYPNRLTLYSEFLPLFQKVSARGLVSKTNTGYGWDFASINPVADKAFELYTILYSVFGPDISIAQYLNAMEYIETHSLEHILEHVFDLVPSDEE
jgi:hypothetical protein